MDRDMKQEFNRRKDFKATEYSDKQFKAVKSFSVMKDVCNDEVFDASFDAGAEWAWTWCNMHILGLVEAHKKRMKKIMADDIKSREFIKGRPWGE